MITDKLIISRFLNKVIKINGCWIWSACLKNTKSYGRMRIARKTQTAHRVSYQIFVGDIPDGICVCHKCDTPACANPNHLFLGTHSDNTKDAFQKGRLCDLSLYQKKGHRTNASVTDDIALLIKQDIKSGIKPIHISKNRNVKYDLVMNIKSGRCYGYV